MLMASIEVQYSKPLMNARKLSWKVLESYGNPCGTFWKSSCQLVVANARLLRKMPGRKTDMKYAQWIVNR